MKRVVVFGATGAVGVTLIEQLVEKEPSWNITAVSRSGPPNPDQEKDPSSVGVHLSKLPNVKIVKGEAENVEEATEICRDAAIVYCTVGFAKYQTKYWSEHWPKLTDSLLQATAATKGKLVFCDNLYAYGPGTDVSPASKLVEASLDSKFGVRAIMHEKFEKHMEKYPQSLTVVGGADFFGPRATKASAFGDIFIGNIVHGKNPMAIGSKSVIHDVCFVTDFSNALYVASINNEAYGKFWVCPHAIHGKTVEDIAYDVSAQVHGKDNASSSVSVLPPFILSVLGIFDKLFGDGVLSEMKEMLPWWTKDYTVDDSDFTKAFQVEATPYESALATTIGYFQEKK